MEHHVSGAVLLHSPTTNSYRGTLALSEGCDLSYSHSAYLISMERTTLGLLVSG
jgi:hypothetical protein